MPGPGASGSAAIFSAGSLAAFAWGQLAAVGGQNQVYLIEFASMSELEGLDLGFAATFQSWNWRPSQGWKPATGDAGLPGRGGLGWRADARRLAARLAKEVDGSGVLEADALAEIEPRLCYLSPLDLDLLVDAFDTTVPPVVVERGDDGRLRRIQRGVGRPVSPPTLTPAAVTDLGSVDGSAARGGDS